MKKKRKFKIIQTNVENFTKNVSSGIRNCILDVYVTFFLWFEMFLIKEKGTNIDEYIHRRSQRHLLLAIDEFAQWAKMSNFP